MKCRYAPAPKNDGRVPASRFSAANACIRVATSSSEAESGNRNGVFRCCSGMSVISDSKSSTPIVDSISARSEGVFGMNGCGELTLLDKDYSSVP